MLICEGRCGRGGVRLENQDNLFVNGKYRTEPASDSFFSVSSVEKDGLFAVCDGMGGEQMGAEASLLAVSSLVGVSAQQFCRTGTDILRQINAQLCGLMQSQGVRIGTTFAGLWVYENQAGTFNLGDSRIYRLRRGKLSRLSQDHTHVQRLLDMGMISPEQAATHPGRHKLTQHLGIFPQELIIEPHNSGAFLLEESDLFLLCSDGLTDMLPEDEICSILMTDAFVGEKADQLYQKAMKRGGKDNITVLLVENRTD